jgi:protein SCO1/2
MKHFLCLAFLFPLAALAAGPTAGSLTDQSLAEIKFDQKPGSQISMSLPFRDESGKPARLGDYFGGKPVILVLGYYGCPMLCTLVNNGLVAALDDLKLDIGKQFDVLNISIDPKEAPALAAAKKRSYLKAYGRTGAATGWHFLTGDEPAIRQIADEAGFRYTYDPVTQQYAHPSGLVILTRGGKVAHYLFGVTFSPKEVDDALQDAAASKVGLPIEQLILLCFHYRPLTGKYGNLIMTVVRISGVATLAGLAGIIVLMAQRKPGIREADR